MDAIAINKADGSQLERAQMAKADYESALHLFAPAAGGWTPPVLLCSAQTGTGITEIWDCILRHEKFQLEKELREEQRREQALAAMKQLVSAELEAALRHDPEISKHLPEIEQQVRDGKITAFAAARMLLSEFHFPRPRTHAGKPNAIKQN